MRSQALLVPPARVFRPEPAACAPGTGALAFARIGPRTVLQRAFATSPLKLLHPRNHGPAAWVYLASYGGGLVGGDAVRLDIDVGPGAVALVSTQASTKVYRSTLGASQQLHARVADEGLLVVAPDPVVCFAGSTFAQEQEFQLSAGAGLVLVDWLNAGRHASGERWAFDRYSSRTIIWRDGRQILYDALRLTPREGALADRMGRFNTLLVAALVGPPLQPSAMALLEQISAMPLGTRADLIVSASALGDSGVLIRMAGVSTEQIAWTLRRFLLFLRPLLGDDPWARKW